MAQQQQQQNHPIFDDVERGDLEAVQQRVLADAAVLDVRRSMCRMTPLIYAIHCEEPAIALWLIEHRGQHDLESRDDDGATAIWHACEGEPLELVQALVAAGADPAAPRIERYSTPSMPLFMACFNGLTDTVAFLLQLPAVRAHIDHKDGSFSPDTPLSTASRDCHQAIVQLLLDAGADPTMPHGPESPLDNALRAEHYDIADLLEQAIDEAEQVRILHKARSLLGAGAASLPCLQRRVEQGQALPVLELRPEQQQQQQQHEEEEEEEEEGEKQGQNKGRHQLQQLLHRLQQLCMQRLRERLWATAAFALGVSGGEKDTGLCDELYLELVGYMLPAWADKGPDNDVFDLDCQIWRAAMGLPQLGDEESEA